MGGERRGRYKKLKKVQVVVVGIQRERIERLKYKTRVGRNVSYEKHKKVRVKISSYRIGVGIEKRKKNE